MIEPYYQDELCTIYNADCRDVLPQLGSVDLVLTDPPYGILSNVVFGNGRGWKGWTAEGIKDSQAWDSDTFAELPELLKIGQVAMVWGGNYYSLPPSRCWLVWVKPDSVATQSSIEMCWTSLDKNAKHLVLTRNPPPDKQHPTQKPLKLMKWCIQQAGEVQTILDPFMGSGTTLRAAKDLGLKSIGIEIERKYCDIAIERLRQQAFNFAEAA